MLRPGLRNYNFIEEVCASISWFIEKGQMAIQIKVSKINKY